MPQEAAASTAFDAWFFEETVTEATVSAVTGEAIAGGSIIAAAGNLATNWVAGGGLVRAAAGFAFNTAIGALFGQRPKSSGLMDAVARGALVNTVSNVEPIPVIYGSRRVGGSRILTEVTGSANELLHVIIVWGEGPVSAINTVYLDGIASTDSKFSGLVHREDFLGADGQGACATLMAALPTKWTAQCTLSGIAYTYLQLSWNQSAFPTGLPQITADIDGRLLYDPRTGTTAFSHNPALAIRDFLTNARYGRGIPSSMIDDTVFSDSASHCEESVSAPPGSQARYTCDGIVSPDDLPFDSLKALLTACRGYLVFSGGQYKLRCDRATATASLALNEDNILGAWSFAMGTKRNRFNRVKARFFDPAQSWQPNLAVQESAAFRTADNGLVLETQIEIPYTADAYRAAQIAQVELKQSRFGIVAQFTATIAATQLEVGDVVAVTHSTPGWSAKLFRVIEIELLNSDEVRLTLREYDASVYTLDTIPTINTAPSTTLPDPRSVAAPGAPTISESLYATTDSAGVKSRATISWSAPADQFVIEYQVEYKAHADTAWTQLPLTRGLSINLDDATPGTFDFRLLAINALGVKSAYSPVTTKELLGLTAAPADITGFTVGKVGGLALATWTLPADLDVQINGAVVIRHANQSSGATWQDGVVIKEFPGNLISGLLDLVTGTYMAKARDSTGNYSVNAVSFVVTEGMVSGFTTVTSIDESGGGFAGLKSNVALTGGAIQLDGTTLIDAMATSVDSWPYIDSLGGINATGSYAFASTLDLGTVATRRFESDIQALSFDTGDLIDDRTDPIDSWDSIDGTAINDCTATLYARTTNDDPAGSPTWTSWVPYRVADFTCRAIQHRLDFASGNPQHNIKVSVLKVDVKTPVSP